MAANQHLLGCTEVESLQITLSGVVFSLSATSLWHGNKPSAALQFIKSLGATTAPSCVPGHLQRDGENTWRWVTPFCS